MGNSREDKIQTGLRVPEKQYQRLAATADRMGVSMNALILMLVDIGLNHLDKESGEFPRSVSRNR